MAFLDIFKRNDATIQQSTVPFNQGGSVLNSFMRSLHQSFFNKTGSNINVSVDSAYQVSAYWLAVRAISEDIAKLPVKAYSLLPDGTKKPVNDIPILKTLQQGFNPSLDPFTGKQLAIQWMQTYGNAYFEISYNSFGEIQLWPIHPTRVQPYRQGDGGELRYHITIADQNNQKPGSPKSLNYTSKEILHLRGMGNEDVGVSIGEVAAESLGIAIAAQNFTGAFFGNNLAIGATLETDKSLNAEQKEEIRGFWKKRFSGPKSAGEMAILDRGFKFNRIQMASTDAELLSTRKFQVEEIARWFRIPPHKLMDMTQAKFANLEQNDLNYITDTLTPWIARVEVQIKFHFHKTDNIYIDIDEKGLARGDMAARMVYYKELFSMQSINAKTIANLEGLPVPDNGDTYYIPLNLAPVDLNIESKELENEQKKKDLEEPEPVEEPEVEEVAPIIAPEEPEKEEETEQKGPELTPNAAISAYLPSMHDSLSRLTRKEHNSHESAAKKEPTQMKEHLDKFYIKFEQELADCFQIHADFICNVQGKEKFTSDKLMFMSKEVCNLEKSENQSDKVIEYLLKEIAQLDDAPKLGEIRQDEDGMNYIWNMSGWVEVDVSKK
jgi:HK97 family phage portal protein